MADTRPTDAEALAALATLRAWLAPAGQGSAVPEDGLVQVNAAGLASFGLELRAVQKLIATGKLKATTVGRRTMTRRSYLLALVDELDAPARPARTKHSAAAESGVDLRATVHRMAKRRARKCATSRGGRGDLGGAAA